MLSYIKPVIQKVNLLQPDEQNTAALVLGNIAFIAILLSVTVSLFLIKFL